MKWNTKFSRTKKIYLKNKLIYNIGLFLLSELKEYFRNISKSKLNFTCKL